MTVLDKKKTDSEKTEAFFLIIATNFNETSIVQTHVSDYFP